MNFEAPARRTLFTLLTVFAVALTACGSKATATQSEATPGLPSSPTPTLTSPSLTPSEYCVTIGYPQPKNAFRAWLALNEPKELEFHNDAGPDGDHSVTKVNRQTLPQTVHVGDSFCAIGQ